MYELFFQDFNKKAGLTVEEQEEVRAFLTPKKLRTKQYLLQEGDVCKDIAYVEKGALREYSIDESGSEHIIQFGIEGWYISDMYSFLTGEPATYNIEAIEDAELVLISREAHEAMLLKIPKYGTLIRVNITGAYLALQRRVTCTNAASLEDRYEEFVSQYSNIVQRVPQHMIASYLGTTPETLSRVRKRIANK